MERFSIHMPKPLVKLLDKDKEIKGLSRAELIRQIVQKYYEDKTIFSTKLKEELKKEGG